MTELDINRSALVLVDLQRDLLDPDGALARAGLPAADPEATAQLVQTCRELIDTMRRAGRPIVWVKSELRPDYLDSGHSPTWLEQRRSAAGQFLVEGSWGAELIDGLEPAPGDHVVVKKGHSAFADTHLDRLLTNLGVEHYVLAGGPVGDTIAETTRTGGRLGYEQFIVEDALFPPKSEDLDMLHNAGDLVLAEDVMAAAAATSTGAAEGPDYALVLIDMQNDFMRPTQENRATILENTGKLLAAMREREWPVVYVRVVRREDNLDDAHPPYYHRRRPAARGLGNGVTHCAVGTWGAEIVDEITPSEGDFVVEKTGGSGFGFTPLHRILRNLNVRRIIMTGGASGGCVRATSFDGVSLGYDITVAADAVYGGTGRPLDVLTKWCAVKSTEDILTDLVGVPASE
jgi:nicotinamidase-related amidase